jgi:CHRD domain
MLKTLGAAFAVALVVAGLAAGAPQKDTYGLTATLKARSEVPRPAGVPAGARGKLVGKVVELANDRARLTWRLTFSRLSGRAIAAHVHVGARGNAGPVLVALCGPCRNGQRGTAAITHAQLKRIEAGRTYVNVHTVKNAGGEIRGQIKASATSSSAGMTPPPSDDSGGEPPLYP